MPKIIIFGRYISSLLVGEFPCAFCKSLQGPLWEGIRHIPTSAEIFTLLALNISWIQPLIKKKDLIHHCRALKRLVRLTMKLSLCLPVIISLCQISRVLIVNQVGSLPSNTLPASVTEWVDRGQSYHDEEQPVPLQYYQEWVFWWLSLQPECRQIYNANSRQPLPRPEPSDLPDDCWVFLLKGGPSGLMQVTRSLSFCYPFGPTATAMTVSQWHGWVSDVMWVYGELAEW